MTQNNNISVLPWYTTIEQQNHRKSYAYGAIYPLFAPANILLPFQIIRPTRANDIAAVELRDKTGKLVANITTYMKNAGLQIVKMADYDIIVYPAVFPLPINQFDGIFYMALSDGVQTWYSEMFTAVQDVSGYLKIEWWDAENLVFDAGEIIYKNPTFRNVLYFCTELGKPDYEFEEEGEERDGYFFPEKQISEKTYKCTILAPEYLCDVMRFIRMADFVKVTDKYGREYDCDTFLITPKWQTQGDLASVEIEFQTDTVVKKLAKGYVIPDESGKDFNNDFNNDFNAAIYEFGTINGTIELVPYSGGEGQNVIVTLEKAAYRRISVKVNFTDGTNVATFINQGDTIGTVSTLGIKTYSSNEVTKTDIADLNNYVLTLKN